MTAPAHRTSAAAPQVGIGWRHPHYATLLEQQPALDFIEVHSENFFAPGGAALAVLREAREHYPVSLHGVGLSLGSAAGIDPWHLDQLARLAKAIEPVRVSDHASFARGPGLHAADLLPVPMNHVALDAMCANVNRVQDRLQRTIAVENLSAYVQWQKAEMDEPAFLNALAQRTGCQLLVDVNNIYVNALNAQLRGESLDPLNVCRRWLDAIQPRHVAELHLAGHVHCGDIVIDDHGSRVDDAVWSLYGHAMERLGAVPTLIEWDTDLPELQVLLNEPGRARSTAEIALQRASEPELTA
ncbi:MAG: DUF692 domain-containing protein [Hydrogenophaga sp.]|uniref:MNIO family bufferin maturase n=1 Tax=Hydrogenophaga sp. TaxID=1904254 RepID=UPI00274695CF|nr:DUF692 domain-containing protein [Hydrogenophaga sp.]MDP2415862.1 DUF692 domain-containing protein [Hydrogenophaga sp.]MDZ4189316.1 DUF692 domain-containing protein [Hydrogenophaga sp.]